MIEGGTLIDGNGGAPVRDALILIQGNKITTVSRKGQVSYPATARVIRADGKFIVPGMMDFHCHYEWYFAELFLNHGITTCVDISGGEEVGPIWREAFARGKLVGPRLYIVVGNVGGAAQKEREYFPGMGGPLNWRHLVKSTEEAVVISKRFVDYGADLIEIGDGAVSPETFRAVVEMAHKAGKPVVTRSLGPLVFAREAVEAGVDIIEHGGGVGVSISKDPERWRGKGETGSNLATYADADETKSADLIKLLVQRGTYVQPDVINRAKGGGYPKAWARFGQQDAALLANPGLAYLPEERRLLYLSFYENYKFLNPSQLEEGRKGYAGQLRFLRQFSEAGGKVLTGADPPYGGVPGLSLHHEFEVLADEGGLAPMKVIQGATKWGAEALRVLDKVGTIEAGKLADLVIVNADPLQSIRNLQEIDQVIFDGRVVDRTYHPWFSTPFPGSMASGNAAIESLSWVAGLKYATFNPNRGTGPSGRYPAPGIETMTPLVATEGDPTLTITIKGFNFFSPSRVLVNNQPVPHQTVSGTELRATIDAKLLRTAGTLDIVVRNPRPPLLPEWGDGTSNVAHLLVNFKY